MPRRLLKVLDDLLDATVVLSFTNFGYLLRKPFFDPVRGLDGKVIVVTGANSGIGLAASCRFAERRAEVIMVCRSEQRGQEALQKVRTAARTDRVHLVIADVTRLESIEDAVASVRAHADAVHALVNNAGLMIPDRRNSVEGIELTFATNVLGYHRMIRAFLPLMGRGGDARIINVSSGGMYWVDIDIDDPFFERRPYDGTKAYAESKRAEVLLTERWARELEPTGIAVHAMHPGWADTPGVRRSLPRFRKVLRPFLRTPDQGADTIVWLAAAPQSEIGHFGFWFDRRRRPIARFPFRRKDQGKADLLWALCESLSNRGSLVR